MSIIEHITYHCTVCDLKFDKKSEANRHVETTKKVTPFAFKEGKPTNLWAVIEAPWPAFEQSFSSRREIELEVREIININGLHRDTNHTNTYKLHLDRGGHYSWDYSGERFNRSFSHGGEVTREVEENHIFDHEPTLDELMIFADLKKVPA